MNERQREQAERGRKRVGAKPQFHKTCGGQQYAKDKTMASLHSSGRDGAHACPPDDCGGIPGYHNLLETLADPKHPDHADLKEWIGGEWDAARFDLDAANAMLKGLKA